MRAPFSKLLCASLLAGSTVLGGCAMQRAPAATDAADATARQVASEFDDENIAAVLSAVNAMEIETSRLALERSQNANVRQFAQRMIRDHSALQQGMNQMLAARGVVPEHNALSLQLAQNLEPTLAELRELSGAEFDRAYIDLQKSAHRDAITSIDSTLAPSARDPNLREFVTAQVRPRLELHYDWIRQIEDARAGS